MTAQRGKWCLGAGALAALIGASCRVPYAPLTPHAASVGNISASVVRVGEQTLGPALVVVQVKFASSDIPAIGDVWLAPRGGARCQAGVRAVAVGPDPWFGWPGVREMSFRRDEVDAIGLMAAVPTVIDLDILPSSLTGERRCLRLPVAEAQHRPEWAAPSRWFLGTGVQSVFPRGGAYADVGYGFLVDLHGGIWVGPARLRLDWLFGQSRTPRPPPAGYDSIVAELLGGALSLELFPIRVGGIGLGVNVGYEWLFTDFHAEQGRNEWDEYHVRGPRGPRVMLRIGGVPSPSRWPGFSNRKDGWAMSLDLIAARWSGLDAPPATRVGIGISMDTGYWW